VNKFFTKFAANAAVKRAGIVAIGCLGLDCWRFTCEGSVRHSRHHGVSHDDECDYAVRDGGAASSDATSQLRHVDVYPDGLYPLQQIQAAQSIATQGLHQAENMQGMINTSTASAKLPSPQQLEAAMLSKDPNQGANVSMLYQQTYGTLPTSQTAPSSVILAVDMGDAVAMASIKKAIALDALADSEMTVSQQLMNELQTTAPGNVPMISAQAEAWILQAHAYTQSGTAQLLRAQSAELGYTGATMKLHSTITGNAAGGMFALPVAGH
jgi:hypothetical protein